MIGFVWSRYILGKRDEIGILSISGNCIDIGDYLLLVVVIA
jgi:hypothetical protein